MGKDKKKHEGELYDAGDILAIITKNVRENGKLKGPNKKTLAYACGHHIRTKSGKLKSEVETVTSRNSKKRYLHCKICKADFTGAFLNDEELRNALRKPQDMIQQMKYVMHASGADKESIRFVTNAAIVLYRLPKYYKDLRKVVMKQNQLSKKGKKREYDDSSNFGAWK